MAPDPSPPDGPEPWIEEIARLRDAAEVDAYVAGRPALGERAAIERLTREVAREARKDLDRAERLSRAADRLAEASGDELSRALGLKARGHVSYLRGRYDEALELYRACQRSFFACGAEVEAALNLCSSSLQTLSLLGRYDEAAADLERARELLERHGDPLLLARLTSNEANVLFRQDRHPEAIARYREALAEFRRSGEPQDIAVALLNLAVASIAVGEFAAALASYREMSACCAEADLPLLAAQADYNIAYLFFFRGEYRRAIEAYQRTRRRYEELGDPYHLALCDLDQAEIYLELNLGPDGARLARRALATFEELGSRHEAAKATAFLAAAERLGGKPAAALELFARARERFEREGNQAWMAMIDLRSAAILCEQGEAVEARSLGEAARRHFAGVPWDSRVALCELLLGRLALLEGTYEAARERCAAALHRLEGLELPALSLQAHFLLGRVAELSGDPEAALAGYREAHRRLEDLRTHLGSEESRLAFLEDKLGVYESLVWMALRDSPSPADLQSAFNYIEQAKSRILADLISSGGSSLAAAPADDTELIERLRELRAELNSCYSQLGRLEAADAGEAPAGEVGTPAQEAAGPRYSARLDALHRQARQYEDRVLETLGEMRSRNLEYVALQTADTAALESIREALPDNTLLLEYFEARGETFGCLLGPHDLQVLRLGKSKQIGSHLQLLLSQMSKFKLGPAYLDRFGELTEQTTRAALERLYAALVAPLADRLEAEHLIVVPHGPLHQLPFHALIDGDDYLLDRFSFSYAPSASVYSLCSTKRASGRGRPLVLGIPDERAPQIRGEVEAVAETLPAARVFLGPEASEKRLRAHGADCRLLHIATHGFFRRDNPMFSAIQLGGSRLTLLDLYNLELGAELVVLSGCGTGLNVVASGDELIGLTRGLLYAGAPSVMVTLWDVHDESTAALMKGFYRRLAAGEGRARALRLAMQELRESYPSPYYWAPFLLIGQPSGISQPTPEPPDPAHPGRG